MFSAIFPIDDSYVVFDTTSDLFKDIDGHCDIEVFQDKISVMKISLEEKCIPLDHIYTDEALIFKYFSTFGKFKVFGDVLVNNCVIYVKTLGFKILLRNWAKMGRSRYTRRMVQPAQ